MPGTSNRGFASMDAQKQREIASKGGKAAHQKGTAHQFTSEEARRAGSKGGRAARQKRTAAQQANLPQTPPPSVESGSSATETNKNDLDTNVPRRTGPISVVEPRYGGADTRRDIKGEPFEDAPEEEFDSDPHHEPLHRAS